MRVIFSHNPTHPPWGHPRELARFPSGRQCGEPHAWTGIDVPGSAKNDAGARVFPKRYKLVFETQELWLYDDSESTITLSTCNDYSLRIIWNTNPP